jgi:hypothetical protein
MEDLLALSEEPEAPKRPRVCLDERPCQWLGESREPLPMVPAPALRVDDEDPRQGTGKLFSMAEPLQGWRHLTVTARRTTQACAQGRAAWVDLPFPAAEQSRGVVDHLSPQTPAALYDVFPPAAARRLLRKRECQLTPGHGRWLNMADMELAVLARHG